MPNASPAAPHHGNPSALSAPLHPAGLLYTLLRHGHGLSHEEAARRASASLSRAPGEWA